jgi:ribosome recycling factor
MIKDVIDDAEVRMGKAIDALRRDLGTIRTGRASPSLVDRLTVDYYGSSTPLNQLAGISVPEPRLLVIQPWDRGSMAAIEKAIMKSELGLNPTNDGQVVRIAIPPLTEERRRQLVKLVHGHVEEGKVALRNIRRDAMARSS